MKKINFKKHVWQKYVISAGILGAVTAIALGSMFGYSRNSDDKKGKLNPTKEEDLKNIFLDRKTEPKLYFVEIHNDRKLVQYNPKQNSVEDNKSVTQYLDEYYKKHHALPYLNIRYGSFNFYNQYIEAVSPVEFYNFTKWFMSNVSWGPEIITLKSFSIVKGVEMSGNSITLGSHANKNKEYTTIKFFPDAFFGTLPLYSELDGKGNAQDSLTYKINKNIMTAPELQGFLQNISHYNTIANISADTINNNFFRNIINAQSLKGLKVYAIKEPIFVQTNEKYSDVEKNREVLHSNYAAIIAADSEAEARQLLKNKINEYGLKNANINPDTVALEEKIINKAKVETNKANNTDKIIDKYLEISFNDGSKYYIHQSFNEILTKKEGSETYELLHNYVQVDKAWEAIKKTNSEISDKYFEVIRNILHNNHLNQYDIENIILDTANLKQISSDLINYQRQLEKYEKDIQEYVMIEAQNKKNEDEKKNIEVQITAKTKEIEDIKNQITSTTEPEAKKTLELKKQELEQEKDNLVANKKIYESRINAYKDFVKKIPDNIKDNLKVGKQVIKRYEQRIAEFEAQINKNKSNESLRKYNNKEIKRFKNFIKYQELINNASEKFVQKGLADKTPVEDIQAKLNEWLKALVENNQQDDDLKKLFTESKEKWDKETKEFAKKWNLSLNLANKNDEILLNNIIQFLDDYDTYLIDYNISEVVKDEFYLDLNTKKLNIADQRLNLYTNRLNRQLAFITGEQNAKVEYVEKTYYGYDIAYSYNELISIELLSKANDRARLSWRDFYGLNEFFNDRKNIVGKDKQDIYVYSKKMHDIAEDLANQYPELNSNINYKALKEELQKLLDKIKEVNFKIDKYNNLTVGNDKIQSIFNLLVKYANSNKLPLGFSLLGFNKTNKYFDIDKFKEFISLDKNVLKQYLEAQLNGVNNNNDNNIKLGVNGLIKDISDKVDNSKKSDFEAIVNIIKSLIQLSKTADLTKPEDAKVYAKLLEEAYKVNKKWAENKTANWYHSYEELLEIYSLQSDLNQAIEIANNLDFEEYRQALIDKQNLLLDLRKVEYVLQIYSSLTSFTNKEIFNKLNEVIQEFDKNVTTWKEINKQEITKKQQALSNNAKYIYEALISNNFKILIDKQNNSKTDVINEITSEINKLNSDKTKAQATLTALESKQNSYSDKVKIAFDKTYVGEDGTSDPKSMKEMTIELVGKIIHELKSFNEETEEIDPKTGETTTFESWKNAIISDLENKIQAALNDIANNKDVLAKASEIQYFVSKIAEVEFFSKWFKNHQDNLEKMMTEVKNNTLPALVFRKYINNLIGEIATFINSKENRAYREIIRRLSKLKSISDIVEKDLTIKYRYKTHAFSDPYEKNAEKIAFYKLEVTRLEAKIKEKQDIKQSLESLESNATIKAEFENGLQKILDNLEIVKESDKKLKKYNSILANSAISNVLNPDLIIENKAVELTKELEKEVEKDKIVKQAKQKEAEIKNANHIINIKENELINKEKAANSSGVSFESKFKEFNELKNKFKELINEYDEEFKFDILLTQLRSHGSLGSNAASVDRISFIKELEDSNFISEEWKNLLIPYVENLDIFKSTSSDLVETFNDIKSKTSTIINSIYLLNEKLKDDRQELANKIVAEFNLNVEKVFSSFSEKDLYTPKAVQLFEEVQKIIDDFKLAFIRNNISGANSYIEDLSNEFASLKTYLEKTVGEQHGYASLLYAYLNSQAWEKEDLFKQQYASIFTKILKHSLKYGKKEKNKIITYLEIKIQSSTGAEKQKFEKRLAAVKKVQDIIPDFEKTLEEIKDFDVSNITNALDIKVFFNTTRSLLKKSEAKLDKQLAEAKKYLEKFVGLFDTQAIKYNIDKKLLELLNSGISKTKDLVYEVRKKQIIKDLREKTLHAKQDEWINDDDLIVAKSRIELIDSLIKNKIVDPKISNEEINKLIFRMRLTDLSKDGKKIVFTLKEISNDNITFEETNDSSSKGFSSRYIRIAADAEAKYNIVDSVSNLLRVLGYKKLVAPTLIKEQNEVKNNETGNWDKTYDLFADAYEGLTRKLLETVPYAGEWLNGDHIVQKINDKGEIEYKLENGSYLGFTKDTRVGLWAILKMSDKNFKGISTDFLKFVGAHEYGHHITLNGAHDLSNKGSNPIFMSALTPNATPNINNYYSKDVVELYLQARTHVELDTKRLLDEFGVEQDYGEYATFIFPKLDKSGKVSFSKESLEKDKDIWGVELDSQDIHEALKNKDRRFLQNYAGMLNAIKSRKAANGLTGDNEKWLSPFDLWIINAIDFYSGTLNPTVDSNFENAAKVKYMVKDADGKYRFMNASLGMLKGVIKDGTGQLIDFEEINIGGKIELIPKVVEGIIDPKTGKYVQINKVLIRHKDGSPIINVPLNVRLDNKDLPTYDPNAIDYINNQILMVINTIKSLIVTRFSINGWDNINTRLDVKPEIDINYSVIKQLFGNTVPNEIKHMFFNIYKDYVKVRDPKTGKYATVDKNNKNISKFMKYYNFDGTVNTESEFGNETALEPLIYGNPWLIAKEVAGKKQIGFAEVLQTMFLSGNSFGNMMNGGEGQILYIDENHQYMPNVNSLVSYEDLFFKQSLPAEYMKIFEARQTLKWMSKITPAFVSNIPNSRALWLMKSANNNFIGGTRPNNYDYNSINHLAINYTDELMRYDTNPISGLFGLVKGEKGTFGREIKFESYEKWLDFVTVDLSKAKFDSASNTVNWDINYVKSKVDLEKFKNDYKINVIDKLNNDKNLQKYCQEFMDMAKDNEQIWANEIMNRFSTSLFAMFNSCLTFQDIKNNPDLLWIFDKQYGYGTFKKQEFTLKTPNKEKWEIDKDDFVQAYEKIANKLDVNLDQLNLFDSLVFDNKIQAYTSQTTIEVSLKRFEVLNIFASLATANFFTSPSADVLNYFKTKNERKFNEMFSDYTYNFAEVINRDNLQITYSPSIHDFGNMPSFLSGISESNTGLEYIVDGTSTKQWNDKLNKFKDPRGRAGIVNAITDYEYLVDLENKYKAEVLNLKYKKRTFTDENNLNETNTYRNNYFGDFQSINNGWFKDRWYRDILDFKLYDDNGEDIKDDTIRIKDLTGKKVQTRAKAYWEYYIQSQGVGRRNISSIWRDSDKDAVAMFGYLTSDMADKVNYLMFEDTVTGEKIFVNITKNNTDNMFYYKKQHILNEKKFMDGENVRHTLKDEEYDFTDANGHHKGKGFVAWVSDYVIMSKYRNKLLTPGHNYRIFFSGDKEGKTRFNVDLGSWESLAENGKTFSQAPIRITKYRVDEKNNFKDILDEKGKKIFEPRIYVSDQFNGVK